jgi:hypothetical protein
MRKRDRAVEGAPLLREYGVCSLIEGSNPSVSASQLTSHNTSCCLIFFVNLAWCFLLNQASLDYTAPSTVVWYVVFTTFTELN